MSSLMSFEIRLSDIWIECQKELIEMNDKIIELNHCLSVWQKICKHLETCNESLVAIVERCPVSYKTNKDIVVLINGIQTEEEYIERQKQNLKTFDTKCKFNEQKVVELMAKWKGCQSMTTSWTQTEDNENCFEDEMFLIPKPETNELVNGLNEDNNRLVVDEMSDVSNDEDFAVDDGIEGVIDVDDSDSEFEIKLKKNKNRKKRPKKKMSKCDESDTEFGISSKKSNRKVFTKSEDNIILDNKAILEMKVDDNFVCNQTNCDYKSNVRKDFLKHFRRHFAAMRIVSEHLKQTIDLRVLHCLIDDTYVCKECQFSCEDKFFFYDHIRRHELKRSGTISMKMIEEYKVNDNYVCNQTDCEFSSCNKKLFCDHIRSHRKRKRSEILTTDESNEFTLDMTEDYKVDDIYVCNRNDCEFTSCDRNVFCDHIKSHRRQQKSRLLSKNGMNEYTPEMIKECQTKDKTFVCNQTNCVYQSKNRKHFLRHYGRHFGCDAKYMSNFVDTSVQRNDRINEILLVFKVDDRYVCSLKSCQFSSVSEDVFCCHLKESHKHFVKHAVIKDGKIVERPYVCHWPECGMAFQSKPNLDGHLDIHNNKRKYVCEWPGCDYRSYSSWHIKSHGFTHTNARPWVCSWPGCTFRCNQAWALTSHKRTHTGEKPHACPWPACNYRTSQSSALIIHQRRHTGEKPFTCEIEGCGQRFSCPAGISAHKKSKHFMVEKKETIIYRKKKTKKIKT